MEETETLKAEEGEGKREILNCRGKLRRIQKRKQRKSSKKKQLIQRLESLRE
jgi:hypothetical protein